MYEYLISFLVVNTIAVGLRLFSRGYIARAMGADDWAMVAAFVWFDDNFCIYFTHKMQLSYVATSIILLLALHYGLGIHVAELALDPPRLQNALKVFPFCNYHRDSATYILIYYSTLF